MLADLLTDRDQIRAQFLEAMVLVDFRLRFAPDGGRRKRFGDRFAVYLTGESDLWIVSRIVGFGAVTGGLPTTASDGANGTGTQIAEGSELLKNLRALGFQFRQGIGHKG